MAPLRSVPGDQFDKAAVGLVLIQERQLVLLESLKEVVPCDPFQALGQLGEVDAQDAIGFIARFARSCDAGRESSRFSAQSRIVSCSVVVLASLMRTSGLKPDQPHPPWTRSIKLAETRSGSVERTGRSSLGVPNKRALHTHVAFLKQVVHNIQLKIRTRHRNGTLQLDRPNAPKPPKWPNRDDRQLAVSRV